MNDDFKQEYLREIAERDAQRTIDRIAWTAIGVVVLIGLVCWYLMRRQP